MFSTFRVAVCALVLVSASAVQPGRAQTAPPQLGVEAQLQFLSTAKVVRARPIGKGITGALRVTLSDGVTTHDAAFQSIAAEPLLDGKRRAGEMRFVDHYRYNIAAWRLASQLGLGHMMPPTIERHLDGKAGALSWWVDDVMMDEAERESKDLQPPDGLDFSRQRQRMAVFAELVRDTDRNKGNVVYTKDWRVVMLDFTRAFRLDTNLRTPALLSTCDRRLLPSMRALTRDSLDQAVGDTLTKDEVRAVLGRRDALVAHFERLIAQRGEGVVLY